MRQNKGQKLKDTLGCPPPQERRVTNRLLTYWRDLPKNGQLPHENAIDPEALQDIWESCFLIHAYDIGKGSDYNYTFLGSNIMRAYGTDLTRNDAPPLASPSAEKLAVLYTQVLATRAPVINEDQFVNAAGKEIRYRQCLLPFGSGDTVTSIFGGMRYKLFG